MNPERLIQAIAVRPGSAGSIHTRLVPRPVVADVPGGRGVLIRVLRVGLDGTDREICDGLFGTAPEGDDYRAAVIGAGTIGLLATLVLRLRGVDVTVISRRQRPYRNSDLVEALGATYLSTAESTLAEAAGARGPFDLIFEASGFSPLAFEAAAALGPNGVLVLSGVTGGSLMIEIDANAINQGFVLGNKVMLGTVNASRADFVRAVEDMLGAEAFHPGWLERLLTTPIDGLGDAAAVAAALDDRATIKAYVEMRGAPDVGTF